MTDTPETDAVNAQGVGYALRFYAMKTHARKLERERDEAREALETGGLLGILDRAGHNRAEAIRERDEIRAQLREEQQLHIQTLDERDALAAWKEARSESALP